MKFKSLLLGVALLSCMFIKAQVTKYTVSFKVKTDTITRLTSGDQVRVVEIVADNFAKDDQKDFKLFVSVDDKQTSMPPKDYEITQAINGLDLKTMKASGNYVIIRIKKDDEKVPQRQTQKIFLKIEVKDGDDVQKLDEKDTEYELNILSTNQPLKNYRFLGYLGTNFDLVDGIQARNLFFATNIFVPEVNKYGFSIGLYGNRTMSRVDTARGASFTSRISSLGDTAIAYYRDSGMEVTKRVSDNLGAYFSPLIPIKFLGDGDLKIYFAPHAEFIWRRTTISEDFLNNSTYSIDTIVRARPLGGSTILTPLSRQTNLNIFDIYIGYVGLLLKYETDEISIRLNASVGTSYNYRPNNALSSTTLTYSRNHKGFFFGRLWITEPSTGLTLGAEMSNYFSRNNALPYYNVTLSKAFNLRDFATLLRPLNLSN